MKPDDRRFLWGAATSSHQIEGHNEKNDWWAWEAEGNIEGGARSGAATDHFRLFKEDIRLAAELGLNSYRFSIEWSRLEPEEGRWNSQAFEWYRELLEECRKHRIEPMLTLHHFTSPHWFAEKGGFTWNQAPARFSEMTREVVSRIGRDVRLWCTLNEPMVLAAGTYLGKFMPPAKFAPHLASQASENLLRCHVQSYDLIKSALPEAQVGIAHNILRFLPDRSWHPMEILLSWVFHRFYNQSWLDAVTGKKQHFGVPGLVPYPKAVAGALGRRTADFIGVNYYTKAYVQWAPKGGAQEGPAELPIGLAFSRRKDTVSDVGWAVHPRGFRKVLRRVAKYGLPIYITENGIADKDDRLRPDYLLSHLRELSLALRDGIDVRGYYHWSLLDNFEWIKGFGPRFGLYRVNYDTFERSPTESARLYRKLILAHEHGPPDPRFFLTKT